MLSPLCRRGVPAAGKLDGWAHLRQARGKSLVHADRTERRHIRVAVIDGSEIKGLVVRGRDHDDAGKLAPFQRGVGVSSDGAGKLISGVRRNYGKNRIRDLWHGRVRQHVVYHGGQRLWVSRIKAACYSRLPYVGRIGGRRAQKNNGRQDHNEEERQQTNCRAHCHCETLLSRSHTCHTPGMGCWQNGQQPLWISIWRTVKPMRSTMMRWHFGQ